MKVVSWNLGAAIGPFRQWHHQAWHWLAAVEPDLALLQECIPPVWATDHWQVFTLPYQHWTSAIVVKREHGLRPLELDPSSLLGRFGSYLATAEVQVGDQTLLVASVHTRAAVAPNWVTDGFERSAMARTTVGEPWSNDAAFAGYRELVAGRPFLIGGDWNTARYVDANGNSNAEGAEFFTRATESDWFEVSLFEGARESRTWYGVDNPRPYQPDHIFADSGTVEAVRSVVVDPYPVVALDLSDHAPLILDLDLGAVRVPMATSE